MQGEPILVSILADSLFLTHILFCLRMCRSFNSVINAYAKSRDADAAIKAQDMLDLMEKLHEQGNEEIRPDVHSFCTVINGTLQ
jgi:pentatricopeptide repeat protein